MTGFKKRKGSKPGRSKGCQRGMGKRKKRLCGHARGACNKLLGLGRRAATIWETSYSDIAENADVGGQGERVWLEA